MPVKKTTSPAAAASTPVAASAPAPVKPAAAPAPAKAASAPAPAPVPVSAPAPASPVPESEAAVEVVDPFTVLEEKLALLAAALKEVQAQLKVAKKQNDAYRRTQDRINNKRKNAKSAPNGFAKPTKISDELCEFLKAPKNSEKARTDVTKAIHTYVQEKKLSDPTNKRIILAHKDETLKKLLGVTDKDSVTYFNLQRFLKKHFLKA